MGQKSIGEDLELRFLAFDLEQTLAGSIGRKEGYSLMLHSSSQSLELITPPGINVRCDRKWYEAWYNSIASEKDFRLFFDFITSTWNAMG